MNITSNVYNQLICCPEVPPETGGILGAKNNTICDFLFDCSYPQTNVAVYIPNVDKLNAQIKLWRDEGIMFCGMFHSHPHAQPTFSNTDVEYIHTIFDSMPSSVDCLYFPIILPNTKIIPYKAIRTCQGITIFKDTIKIIKEY